jgi:hypothetical protein
MNMIWISSYRKMKEAMILMVGNIMAYKQKNPTMGDHIGGCDGIGQIGVRLNLVTFLRC